MANTKSLTRPLRKAAKKKARQNLKTLYASLTREQRGKYKKEGKKLGLKRFLKDIVAAKEQAAPKAPEAVKEQPAVATPADTPPAAEQPSAEQPSS